MLLKMNHNDVALPFMVDDYRISNSVSQFSGQHTHGFCMAGAVKEDQDFNGFLLYFKFFTNFGNFKISWHDIDLRVRQCILKECNYQSTNV